MPDRSGMVQLIRAILAMHRLLDGVISAHITMSCTTVLLSSIIPALLTHIWYDWLSCFDFQLGVSRIVAALRHRTTVVQRRIAYAAPVVTFAFSSRCQSRS